MNKRINVTLPEETVELVNKIARKGDRSHFIDAALKHYIKETAKKNLRKRLKEGAINRAERDLRLAEEWFPIEEEACPEKS
ncbi:ribbon-helix-helix domain-containing protein [Thermodesulfobacteriota bacterium]